MTMKKKKTKKGSKKVSRTDVGVFKRKGSWVLMIPLDGKTRERAKEHAFFITGALMSGLIVMASNTRNHESKMRSNGA